MPVGRQVGSNVAQTRLPAGADIIDVAGFTLLEQGQISANHVTHVAKIARSIDVAHLDVRRAPSQRNFGHLAYEVDNVYETCQRLMDHGVTINRPPRDGRMAFVRSPDNISVELLQKGGRLEAAEPWKSMQNVGVW